MGGSDPIDVDEFSKRLRAARVFAEIDTADELVEKLEKMGFKITRDRIYAFERGESFPRFHDWMGLVIVLNPPGGLEFFRPAIRPDVWDRFIALAQKTVGE